MAALTSMEVNPRTNLPIIDIPPKFTEYFADLKGSVIHWLGYVDKFNQKWKKDSRVCIVSDECIYLCRTDGGITRCVQIKSIEKVALSQTAIGFKVAQPDYDMLIATAEIADRDQIYSIVSKIYYSITGKELEIFRIGERDNEQSTLQSIVNLKKPDNWVLVVNPLHSSKGLSRMLEQKAEREAEDRKIVEDEFKRIKKGIIEELQRYQGVEYDQMQKELERREKLLNERDMQIAHLKQTSVNPNDPETWRKCPNCKNLRKSLESHPNDDKQKVFRLQRDIESQRHIVQHLQAALLHRNNGSGTGQGLQGDKASAQIVSLEQQLEQAKFKNRELQQLILDSPYLTSDVKYQALQLAYVNPYNNGAGAGYDGGQGGALGNGQGRTANSAILMEKDREIQHLKSTLRDVTFKHVQELEMCRRQLQQYDTEVAQYVQRLKDLGADSRGNGGNGDRMAALEGSPRNANFVPKAVSPGIANRQAQDFPTPNFGGPQQQQQHSQSPPNSAASPRSQQGFSSPQQQGGGGVQQQQNYSPQQQQQQQYHGGNATPRQTGNPNQQQQYQAANHSRETIDRQNFSGTSTSGFSPHGGRY